MYKIFRFETPRHSPLRDERKGRKTKRPDSQAKPYARYRGKTRDRHHPVVGMNLQVPTNRDARTGQEIHDSSERSRKSLLNARVS